MVLPIEHRDDEGLDAQAWAERLRDLRRHGKGVPRDLSPAEREEARRRRRQTLDMLREAEEGWQRWEQIP